MAPAFGDTASRFIESSAMAGKMTEAMKRRAARARATQAAVPTRAAQAPTEGAVK